MSESVAVALLVFGFCGVFFFSLFLFLASEDSHYFDRITPDCVKVIEVNRHAFSPDVRTEGIYCKADLKVVR